MSPTPAEEGYRLAADAAPAQRFWLAWPRPHETGLCGTILAIAETLSDWAPVTLLTNPAELAEVSLRCPRGVTAMVVVHEGARLRSGAPLFLRRPDDGSIAVLLPDSPVAQGLADHLNCPVFTAPQWLRPDMLEADGSGILLASEAMLSAGPREQLEATLRALTGTEQVVWLPTHLAGCPGTAVRLVARCLGPGLALTMVEDSSDDNGELLREVRRRLQAANFTLVTVPQPSRRMLKGVPLPSSYCACIVVDHGVLLPAFEESRDDVAAEAVSHALPNRVIGQEPARELTAAGLSLSTLVVAQPKGL